MNMNRKRWTKILMGAVCGVMLTAVSTTMTSGQNAVETPPSQAPEDPAAFTCEARIGNASASGGEFEYDIGPDTAHPAQLGQFTRPNNQSVSFVIEYDAATRTATYKLGSSQAIQYTVPSGVFDTLNGYADIHLRTRNTDTGRSMMWKDLVVEVWNGTNYEPYDITRNFIGTSMTATNDSRTMMICAVPKMQRGFKVSGNVALAWDPNKPTPARSHINGQISFRERSGVVKVEWEEVNDDPYVNNLGPVWPYIFDPVYGNGLAFFAEKNYQAGPLHDT